MTTVTVACPFQSSVCVQTEDRALLKNLRLKYGQYLLDGDIQKLEQLATGGHSRDFRDLARLHVVGLRGDDMTAADVEQYLAPLDTKKSPYYYTGRLTVAKKYLADGDRTTANKWLDVIINDADAPAVISANAQALR